MCTSHPVKYTKYKNISYCVLKVDEKGAVGRDLNFHGACRLPQPWHSACIKQGAFGDPLLLFYRVARHSSNHCRVTQILMA